MNQGTTTLLEQNSNKKEAITYISKKLGLPMKKVGDILTAYKEFIDDRVGLFAENPAPISFGILPIDNQITLHPGITILYGAESSGKTLVR